MLTKAREVLPGVSLCIFASFAVTLLARLIPLIGAPVLAVLLCILISAVRPVPAVFSAGIKFCGKKVLQLAIIFLGLGMNLTDIAARGGASIIMISAVILTAFAVSFLLGKALKASRNDKLLIGIGTAICGASAVAAAAPVIKADDDEISRCVSVIFLFNVIAVLVFPFLGRLFGMDEAFFGTWAGLAINDTSSVMAAASTYGGASAETAAVIKLTRTVFVVPVTLLLAVFAGRKSSGGKVNLLKIFPVFILLFLLASVLHTAGLIPSGMTEFSGAASRFLITTAMAAIGLGTDIKSLFRHGRKPVVMGLCAWVCVAVISFFLIGGLA